MVQTEQVTTIRPRSPWHFLDLKELWDYRELFYILSWRDLKVRYKQTALGVTWALLQPLVNMIVFTVFFGNFAAIPSDGLPYPVFVLLGLTFWGFFSNSLSKAGNSFIENEQLVKKVYFPREILTFSSVVTSFVDFLISLTMLAVVIIYYSLSVNILFIALLLLGIIVTAVSSAGLGLFLASVNIKYRDVRYIIPFFLQLLIFISPVIYPLTIVRSSFQYALALNPMTGVIDSLRSSLVSGSITHPDMLIISIVTAALSFLLGLAYFRRTERYFADII